MARQVRENSLSRHILFLSEFLGAPRCARIVVLRAEWHPVWWPARSSKPLFGGDPVEGGFDSHAAPPFGLQLRYASWPILASPTPPLRVVGGVRRLRLRILRDTMVP